MFKTIRQILLVISLLCVFSAVAYAQVPPATDAEIDLMQRSQMVAEIKKLRAESAGLTTQVTELKAQIEVYKQLDAVQEARVKDLKEALLHGDTALGIFTKIEDVYKERVNEFKDENLRLRTENDKLRKSRDRRTLIFGIAGLALGHFLF